ncbi:popeye domain-containing protein 2 isoform X2 [Rana temporaria]|uniref:popeye domain-containing protein 2 isoform X2 n=1 Tax=Rana temporaria TaxID=8407 RepID=UPI001AAD92E1|nr:popeye domain-containing protein 2 isoform X2 [Rana temporaria]
MGGIFAKETDEAHTCPGVASGMERNMEMNRTLAEQLFHAPNCVEYKISAEWSIYHLACLVFLLASMGGSGIHGCIFILLLMAGSFCLMALWGGLFICGVDIVTWNAILMALCVVHIGHLIYRLHRESYGEDYDTLYQTLYKPMHVPLNVFKDIAHCSGMEVHSLNADQSYALEGKTPIDRLSLLISGRVKVSLDGQFLHYIFPYQFLDSPEWESLRPSEEGTFQVTLTAEMDSAYISWPRKKLYLLLAKEKYIARLFSSLLGFDISQKLYALNDKLFAKFGLRFDIRLPSLYHVVGLYSDVAGDIRPVAEPLASRLQQEDPLPRKAPPPSSRGPRPESGNLASTVLHKGHPRLQSYGRAPLAPTQTPEL